MLGIRGLDPFGLVHAAFGLASVVLGAAVVLRPKGGRAHRRTGFAYAAMMLSLNTTALFIYDLFGRFGPFHWLALLSLATLACGMIPAWRRRPATWLDIHARCMSWSYAGVVMACVAAIGARVPGVRFVNGVVWPGLAVMIVAGILIRGRVPLLVARVRVRQAAAGAR